jgi:hypothetical protein
MPCDQPLESETSGQFLSIMFFYHRILSNPKLIVTLFATCWGFNCKAFYIYFYTLFLDILYDVLDGELAHRKVAYTVPRYGAGGGGVYLGG